MKKKFLSLICGIMMWATHSQAVTCVQNVDWVSHLCELPVLPGTRCVNAEFFRAYCAPGTVGCETVPGGCFGFTPVGHWYPVIGGAGVPEARCQCGCFAEETLFTRESGESVTGRDIISIYGKESETSFTVSSLDFLDSAQFSDREINGVRFGGEKEPVIEFRTKSGRRITVTKSHPMVVGDENGSLVAMKAAAEVRLGDLFVDRDGQADTVVSKREKVYRGSTVNFNILSDDPVHHIIEANGVLTGDQGWQDKISTNSARLMWRNDLLKFLNARKKAGVHAK